MGLSRSPGENRIAGLYEKYRYDCLYVALGILKEQSLAEDAVHDAFVSVMEQGDKYLNLSDEDFRKLILVIVKNRCFDALRRSSRVSLSPFDDSTHEPEAGRPSVEDLVEQRAERQLVSDYIRRLDETSRQVLRMKYELGMSYKEIAKYMGTSIKNVEVRIARAKRRVRSLAEKEEENERQTNR